MATHGWSYYQTTAWGVRGESQEIERFKITRRDTSTYDVELDIYYCGVNQIDTAFITNEYGNSRFPLVPGCEISGRVSRIGPQVPSKFKVGDNVAVGLVVGSCMTCEMCKIGEEQACIKDFTQVYNSNIRFIQNLMTDRGWTFGGFSSRISIHYRYVVKVPSNFPLEYAAPTMVLGLATYSSLKHWKAHKGGLYIGVIGMGLMGILAIQMANVMGNEVTAISSTDGGYNNAKDAGAIDYLITPGNGQPFDRIRGRRFDLLLNTMSQPHDVSIYLPLLTYGGTIIQLGLISDPVEFIQFPDLMRDRLTIAGSFLGGMCDAQDAMDFSATHNLRVPVNVITCDQLGETVVQLTTEYGLDKRNLLDIRKSYHILLGHETYDVLTGSMEYEDTAGKEFRKPSSRFGRQYDSVL